MWIALLSLMSLGLGLPADGSDSFSDLPHIAYESTPNPGEGDLVFNPGFIAPGVQVALPSVLPLVYNNSDPVTLFLILQAESFSEVRLDYFYLSESGLVGDPMSSTSLDPNPFGSSVFRYPYQIQTALSCEQGEVQVALRITAISTEGNVENFYTSIQLVPTQNGAPCHGGILVGNPLNSDQVTTAAPVKVSQSIDGCGVIQHSSEGAPWWMGLLMILVFCLVRLQIQPKEKSEN